ncbi:hypothetical protein TthTF19_24100 (plasmid) [Thermus thermophilus]
MPEGEAKGVPRAWGKEGRVNVVGHLVRGREGERLFFALLEGPVRWEVVRGYLDRVAESLGRPLKVFMDRAPFHRSRGVEERKGVWRGRGLMVAYLPRYSPHLNPMEGVWRRVKGSMTQAGPAFRPWAPPLEFPRQGRITPRGPSGERAGSRLHPRPLRGHLEGPGGTPVAEGAAPAPPAGHRGALA